MGVWVIAHLEVKPLQCTRCPYGCLVQSVRHSLDQQLSGRRSGESHGALNQLGLTFSHPTHSIFLLKPEEPKHGGALPAQSGLFVCWLACIYPSDFTSDLLSLGRAAWQL